MSPRSAHVPRRQRRAPLQSTNGRRRWLGIEFLEDRRLLATRVLDFNALPGNANVGTQVSEDGFLVQSIASVLATRGSGYAFSAAQGVTLYNGTVGGDTRIVRQDGGNFKLTSLQLNSLNAFASAFVPFTAFPSAGGSSNFNLVTDSNFNAFQTFASPTSVNLSSLMWDQVNNAGDYHQFDNVTLEIGPLITSVGNVSPDPTTTAVSTLNVTFDTTINLATFTFADLTLTRNGTPVPLTGAVTISLASGTTYTINGLSPFTALSGNYVLTVNALNIRNAADLQGMGTASELWTMDTPPQVASTTPSLTSSGVISAGATSLQVQFNEPVTGANSTANYELQRAGADGLLGNADDQLIPITSATYASGSNTATLNFAGLVEDTYRLIVKDGITDATGNALDGDANGVAGANWQRDVVVIDSVDYLATPGADTQTLTVSGDAGLRGDNRNSPEGTDDKLVLNENQLSYTLLKFDLSNVSRFVKKATVRMEWHTSTVANQGVGMYVFGNPWNESSVTWNNVNGGSDPFTAVTGGVIAAVDSINFGPGTQIGTFADWDVTSAVRQWTQGTLVNNGLLMRTAAGHISLAFHSKEGHFAPQLILELADVDVDSRGGDSGQLVHGRLGSFDGLNRLSVGGVTFAPPSATPAIIEDAGKTITTATASIAGLNITREITVPAVGSQAFIRSVNVLTNPSGSAITVPVRTFGNLGSDAATTVFATSDGDTLVEPTDWWFGTDDADGSGTPAIIHLLHGPSGLQPTTVNILEDNVEWTYNLTIPAGQTQRLASFTILGTTRADAIAAVNALIGINGFTGEAAAFLTSTELQSLANFQFNTAPTDIAINQSSINENSPVGSTIGTLATTDFDSIDSFTYSFASGTGDSDNNRFTIVGNQLRTAAGLNFESQSNYTVRIKSTDQGGLTFEKILSITVIDLPEMAGAAVVGDGTVQRSLVNQVVITFDGAVDIAPGAFVVDKLGSSGGSVTTSVAAAVNGTGQTVVTLTFSGAFTRGLQGALADGYYRMTIDATKITRAGRGLDANSDGISGDNYVIGATEADNFFALFGDTNGDGLVGVAEFGQFRSAFGKTSSNAGYNALFDYDGDGAVGVADFGQFRARFGKPKLTM